MASPCYNGPNPIKDDERLAVWNWAKENAGIDKGVPIEEVGNAINEHFYGGQGKPEWINDILSGRKTPFKAVANDMWKKQYNRRVVTQQAKEISQLKNMGPVGKLFRTLWTAPRSLAVFGHGVVFPITHAGDLAFRPTSWGTFVKGTLRTYRGAFDKAYSERMLRNMEGSSLFDTALRTGLDVGKGSHPSGLISRSYHGPAQRAWDMLTVMRYELWKKQMGKYVKPGMSEAVVNDIGANLADWANHATGSGKGWFAKAAQETAFGPKLTQSKLNRLTVDPVKTAKTFANWDAATPGERAVAMTRLSGSTQYLLTNLGFLAVNAGVLTALRSDDKINFSNPFAPDFLSFKGSGIEGKVPGLTTETKTLAKMLATSFASKKPPNWMPNKLAELQKSYHKQLKGESKFGSLGKTTGQYFMGKATPAIQRGLEVATRQNFAGQPVPWSEEEGTMNRPKLSAGEYAGDIGPIPLSGPVGYVYDQIKKSGATGLEAHQIVKALIIGGLGLPGFHVREEFEKPESTAPPATTLMPIDPYFTSTYKEPMSNMRKRCSNNSPTPEFLLGQSDFNLDIHENPFPPGYDASQWENGYKTAKRLSEEL